MSELDHKIVNFIKHRMKNLDITIETVAKTTGITKSTLSRIFSFKRPIQLDEKFILFKAVGIDQREILTSIITDDNCALIVRPFWMTKPEFKLIIDLTKKIEARINMRINKQINEIVDDKETIEDMPA